MLSLMWRGLGILKEEWQLTPQAVQIVLACLHHQFHALKIRCAAYEQQLAIMRPQAIQIEDLKAEVAELRERLSQNSRNSSRPPSSDQLSHQPRVEKRPTGRRRGAQVGHQGHAIKGMVAGSSRQQSLIILSNSDQSVAPNVGNYCWVMTLFLSAIR